MSETRRTVSVEIVYDGDNCGHTCLFFSASPFCTRHKRALSACDGRAIRCDECKAEDAHAFTVVPADGSPQYTVTITPDMASKIKRELSESKKMADAIAADEARHAGEDSPMFAALAKASR